MQGIYTKSPKHRQLVPSWVHFHTRILEPQELLSLVLPFICQTISCLPIPKHLALVS